MQEIFTKIRERLEEKSLGGMWSPQWIPLESAIEIVNEVEAEYGADIEYNIAKRYAVCLKRYGVDISGNFDSAVKMEYALNQAYMRGIQDERYRFREHETVYSNSDVPETNAGKSDGWILCNEEMPKEKGLYIVSYGRDTEVIVESYNGVWFDEHYYCEQPKAWMHRPEPYQQKGE